MNRPDFSVANLGELATLTAGYLGVRYLSSKTQRTP